MFVIISKDPHRTNAVKHTLVQYSSVDPVSGGARNDGKGNMIARVTIMLHTDTEKQFYMELTPEDAIKLGNSLLRAANSATEIAKEHR
jgi:hypothetical protein